ncbi:MAG: thioesterase domain-containing protein [Gammaproteobacteria bacterium]|nr:thioesterase domain-containing protein [Gammaproteobacteria bacterium]
MKTICQELEQTLYHEIPLTQAMGIKAVAYDGTTLELSAPISLNSNHKSTFFGGSLYTVAVTTGWALLHLKTIERALQGHVVIHEASINYSLPVHSDVRGRCRVDAKEIERFERLYRRRGKSAITLSVELVDRDEKIAAVFSGRYALV